MLTRFMIVMVALVSVVSFGTAYAADEPIEENKEALELAELLVQAASEGDQALLDSLLAQVSSTCGANASCYDIIISAANDSGDVDIAPSIVASVEGAKFSNIAPAAGNQQGQVASTLGRARRGGNSPAIVFNGPPVIENPGQVSQN